MKAPSLILIIFLVCMIILLAGAQLVGEHNQRASNQTMEKVIAELTARSRGLESEIKDLRAQLASQEQQAKAALQEVTSRPATQIATTNSSTNKPAKPQAFQAKAYVGKDYLGTAWVVPSNVHQDPESGEYRFEPIIWLNEQSRKAFTQTNVVEREVVRNSSYTQVYQQPYWYGYPVWVRPQSNHHDDSGHNRPPVPLPSPNRPGNNTSAPIIGSTPSAPIIGSTPSAPIIP